MEYGVIGHGVNCQKKMKSGVAKSIREKWPSVYEAYMSNVALLGTSCVVQITDELYVTNMYTQQYYGYDDKRYADLNAIERCTRDIIQTSLYKELPLYLPKIGSDRGGLDWYADVVPVLNRAIQAVDETAIINICEWS